FEERLVDRPVQLVLVHCLDPPLQLRLLGPQRPLGPAENAGKRNGVTTGVLAADSGTAGPPPRRLPSRNADSNACQPQIQITGGMVSIASKPGEAVNEDGEEASPAFRPLELQPPLELQEPVRGRRLLLHLPEVRVHRVRARIVELVSVGDFTTGTSRSRR